jgi:L-seryl-tRNA(Ser) seleniumtransferase
MAGLAATLLHYLEGQAEQKVPVWQMISMPPEVVERRAREWAEQFKGLASVTKGESVVGGGSLPGSTLPTWLLAIRGTKKAKRQVVIQELAARLRAHQPPVVGRLEGNSLLLDPRTVRPEDDHTLIQALRDALDSLSVAREA